ncbi:MAG TPA: hypothetical protein VJC20_01645 [Candidatus Paceibacterota bacterium]
MLLCYADTKHYPSTKRPNKSQGAGAARGIHSLAAWVQFLIEKRVCLEESPKLKPAAVISEIKNWIVQRTVSESTREIFGIADKTNQ